MPDNTILPPGGGGDTIRTEDFAGVKLPASKMVLGPTDVDEGDVSRENPMPIRDIAISPQVSYGEAIGVAPGGQGTLDSVQVTSGKVAKLVGLIATGTAAFKADLRVVANGAVGQSQGIAIPTDHVWSWKTPAKDYVKVTESPSLGFDGFRLVITNLDTGAQPSNFYVIYFFDEETP